HRSVGCAGAGHDEPEPRRRGRPPHEQTGFGIVVTAGYLGACPVGERGVDTGHEHASAVVRQKLPDDGDDLARLLARGVDRLGSALPRLPGDVNPGESQVDEALAGQPADLLATESGSSSFIRPLRKPARSRAQKRKPAPRTAASIRAWA